MQEEIEDIEKHSGLSLSSEMFTDGAGAGKDDQNGRPGAEEKSRINPYLKHKPLKYGKKLYVGEFIAERLIQIIAFLSIGFIIAIFYYVFQESVYAFKTPKPVTAASAMKSESGGSNTGSEMQPESYGGVEKRSGDLQPESYGGVEKDIRPANEPETAQAPAPAAGIEAGVTGEEAAETGVTVGKLIMPNDYIDNKPAVVWQPISSVPKYSFIPLFAGALKVTITGLMIAAPIAILAAIFTVAFAPRRIREIIKPAIEILAGFPSVVIGFFCLITLATFVQNFFHTTYRLNSFVGGLGMALAVIPIIYTVTEDALSSVPKYMSEASLALGASRWQTAFKVLLPAATPGVFAAVILGFGRAFGETMIALMATGNAALASLNIFDSVRTMAATIGAEMAEVEFRGVHYGVLFLIGAVLFVVTFTLNAIAEFYVRKRLLKRFQGE